MRTAQRLAASVLAIVCFVVAATNALAGTPRWQAVALLPQAIEGHATVMLRDGAVFTVGGFTANGTATDAVSILDASTRVLVVAQPLPQARARFACVAVTTATGTDVYVIGGYTGSITNATASARVDVFRYDAATRSGTWRAAGLLDAAVGDCRAVYDGSQAVIVTGGRTQATGNAGTGTPTQRSWRIDASSLVIQRGNDCTLPRANHAAMRFLDANGRNAVLTAGGEEPPPTTVTELLLAGTWDARTNPPRQWRADGGWVTDRSGTARVFGGRIPSGAITQDCEFYDPKSGWRAAPRMSETRSSFGVTAVSGPSDTAAAVLVVGGVGATALTRGVELFLLPSATDPVGSWDALPPLGVAAGFNATALSAWNLPAVSGGRTAAGASATLQMLQPLQAPDITLPPTEVASLSDSVILPITNTWVLPVRVDRMVVEGTAEFIVAFDTSSPTLAAGASRNVLVFFRPAAEGLRSGRLLIHMGPVTDTVQLRGTGLSSTVSLTTTGVVMGDVIVTTQRDTCIRLVLNQGTDTLRIDSLKINDADVLVVSPLGRPRIAPGDTLVVCLRYRPTARRVLAGTLTIHIGGRILPVAVTGRGVRRFVAVQSNVACDTITARVGEVLSLVATLTNPSDRIVTITDFRVTSTTQGTVVLDPQMILPVVVPPGASIPILLLQTVVREGREDVVITTVDDGDTVARGTICTVPRSRAVQLDASVIDVGVVCGGQTIDREIRLENASSLETIVIDNVAFANIDGTTTATLPLVISPRSSVSVAVSITMPVAGVVDGRISFDGQQGSVVATVVGTVSPSIEVGLQNAATFVTGGVAAQQVLATATTPQVFELDVQYSFRVLFPREIVVAAGHTGTATVTNNSPGQSTIRVALDRAPVAGEDIATINWDVLRADVFVTTITTQGSTTQPCVLPTTTSVDIDPLCGGTAGLVFTAQPAIVVLANTPSLTVSILNAETQGMLTMFDMHGAAVEHYAVQSQTLNLQSPRAAGVYALVFRSNSGQTATTTILSVE